MTANFSMIREIGEFSQALAHANLRSWSNLQYFGDERTHAARHRAVKRAPMLHFASKQEYAKYAMAHSVNVGMCGFRGTLRPIKNIGVSLTGTGKNGDIYLRQPQRFIGALTHGSTDLGIWGAICCGMTHGTSAMLGAVCATGALPFELLHKGAASKGWHVGLAVGYACVVPVFDAAWAICASVPAGLDVAANAAGLVCGVLWGCGWAFAIGMCQSSLGWDGSLGRAPLVVQDVENQPDAQGPTHTIGARRYVVAPEFLGQFVGTAGVLPHARIGGQRQRQNIRPAASTNVHETGRDAATRDSLNRLIEDEQEQRMRAIRQHIERFIAAPEAEPLQRRLDANMENTAQAARRILDTQAVKRYQVRYSNITGTEEVWSLQRFWTYVWGKIDQYEPPANHTQALLPQREAYITHQRHLLKQAFVGALARAWDQTSDEAVCPAGQVQQMMLALEGFFDGVQIESIQLGSDRPSVDDFFRANTLRLPTFDNFVNWANEVWARARSVYVNPADLHLIEANMRELARLQEEDWQPLVN